MSLMLSMYKLVYIVIIYVKTMEMGYVDLEFVIKM